MRARQRKPNPISQQIIPLLLLGIGLVTTNNSVTFLDDEALSLSGASNSLRTIFARAASGNGIGGNHPLFDTIYHLWLMATGGNFDYLRIPSILFFLAGLFLLGRASRRFTASSGGIAVIWLGVLWPFGFHFGRLAAWYPFSFFVVSGLTLSYLEYLEDRTNKRWAVLFLFCVALIWTTYLGWAILACLALDQFLRASAKEPAATPRSVLITVVLLCAAFLPFFPILRSELSKGMNLHRGYGAILANLGFNTFSFFASNSVAPWFWRLSVPVALAAAVCVVLSAWWLPRPAWRFLVYSACLVALTALTEILQTKDLLMLSPWVLLPVGIAIETSKPRWATFGLAAALLAIGGMGWYGIYSRRFYSTPQFIEPWQEIAREATAKIADGATIITGEPSLLLYLTYDLRVPRERGPWKFEGLLPDTVRHAQVFSPESWLASAQPANGKIMLIRSGSEPGETDPSKDVMQKLDQSCGSISSRLRMRDEGYSWKRRYLPQLHDPLWRIEVREYDCNSSNSKQIYPIPTR